MKEQPVDSLVIPVQHYQIKENGLTRTPALKFLCLLFLLYSTPLNESTLNHSHQLYEFCKSAH